MISAKQILGLAAAGAALLGLNATATPANAQPACKNERVTAKSEIRAFRNAESEAKRQWEKEAEEQFGKPYGKWANAKDINIECESAKSPTLGLRAKVCTAYGRPCARDDNATVVEEREADKERRGDRVVREREDDSGRRGDRRRFRDRDRFADGRRYPDRDRHSDRWLRAEGRAYARAMAFQDYLARKRHRDEMRAYRRETAYWRNLYRRQSHGYWY